jgi:SSS family solute:Na+ symporter
MNGALAGIAAAVVRALGPGFLARIRRNAIVRPLYQLISLFVFFVEFTAILQVSGLSGPKRDLALFKLSVQTFDPWFVGVIGAGGMLTALVPGSMIPIRTAVLPANNLYRAINPAADDSSVAKLAKLLVPAIE